MADRLTGRTALVVGAGSSAPGWGIGKATAVALRPRGRERARLRRRQRRGERDRRADPLAKAASRSRSSPTSPTAAQVEALVAACIERFGTVDVLQNSVGVVALGGVGELTEDAWDATHAINARSFFLTIKHAIPHMLRQGRGAIVNVSSVGSIRWTGLSYLAYATSKAAVNQLTQSVALEYAAQGIRCNAVLPGLLDTPLVADRARRCLRRRPGRRARRTRRAVADRKDGRRVGCRAMRRSTSRATRRSYVNGHLLVVDGGLSCATP